jgi:ribosomal protein L5
MLRALDVEYGNTAVNIMLFVGYRALQQNNSHSSLGSYRGKMAATTNPMKDIFIEKLVINCCVGESGK